MICVLDQFGQILAEALCPDRANCSHALFLDLANLSSGQGAKFLAFSSNGHHLVAFASAGKVDPQNAMRDQPVNRLLRRLS